MLDDGGVDIGICIVAGHLTFCIFKAFMCENAVKVKLFNFVGGWASPQTFQKWSVHPKPFRKGLCP